MCGFEAEVSLFLIFELVLFFTNLAMGMWFFFLSSVGPNANVVTPLGMCSILVFVIFAGFIVTKDQIPDYLIWAHWISPMSWSVKALSINQYRSDSMDVCVYDDIDYCAKYGMTMGEYYLDLFGIDTGKSWVVYGIIYSAAIYVVFMFLSYLGLEYLRYETPENVDVSEKPVEDESYRMIETPKNNGSAGTTDDCVVDLQPNSHEKNFVAFQDLHYYVPDPHNPKESLELLKGINGFAVPGSITALMGSSGAGKTTLMDVIAGRKTGGKITGKILLNGYEANDLAIRRCTGYCEQMDVHSEAATIREALTFSSFLRQDASISDQNSVNKCIELLGLEDIADQIIRGSSVEQMKRLTIGVELAAQPSRKRRKQPKRGVYPKHLPTFVRERVQEHLRAVEPLLTSWFDVVNFSDEEIYGDWRTSNMPPPADTYVPGEDMTDADEEDTMHVNSIVKLRLFPTPDQKAKLDQMFASNRAVYNKLVACSRNDRLGITTGEKMSLSALCTKYRPIAVLKSMSKYFRNNKRARARHRQVHDEVRDSAFRDFKKAVKSSLALFFAKKARDEKTTYPDMKFKSKFSPSNTIEIRSRSVKTIDRNGVQLLQLHKTFFGFQKNECIVLHEILPELISSVRLQRLREGEYYIIVPRLREFPQSDCKRSCAIDPGVRNSVTVYDPNGRTFSVKDSRAVLNVAVDEMKSVLQTMNNICKWRHPTQVRTKAKKGSKNRKTAAHRFRYRQRRRIRFTSRKAIRAVNDMHQKLSSWLASRYQNVLLPSFQTSEMVRRYSLEVASDATPETFATVQKRKIKSPTARAMMALAHYRFKVLLKYKMERAGGRVIDCEEEYTSKTCSSCGEIKNNLGGSDVFRCSFCYARYDRDVNAARNIFHKNMALLP